MMLNAAQMVSIKKVPISTGDRRISSSTLSPEYLSQTHSLHWSSMNQSKRSEVNSVKRHLEFISKGVHQEYLGLFSIGDLPLEMMRIPYRNHQHIIQFLRPGGGFQRPECSTKPCGATATATLVFVDQRGHGGVDGNSGMDERVRYHGMFDVIGEKPETYDKKANQQY